MIILSADTSTRYLAMGLTQVDHVLADVLLDCGRTHAERFLTSLNALLAQTSLSLKDVDALAVTNGPGSFTGLRIAMSHFKGLACGLEKPLVAVPTLDALCRMHAFANQVVCPLMDAKMDEVFSAVYRFEGDTRSMIREPHASSIADALHGLAPETVFFGDGAQRYTDEIRALLPGAVILGERHGVLHASAIAAEARALLEAGNSASPDDVHPVYLRKSQPEELRDKAASR